MSTKMLWEIKAPLAIAKAKEDMGLNNIFKYLRYYRMFIERYDWEYNGKSYTNRIENLLFWRGKCALYKDSVIGLVVCEISNETTDANGFITRCDLSAENKFTKKDVEVGKDCVIIYADDTLFPPVLYIWSIANEIIDREDIIKQQDNMLRKPIIVGGEGAEFDEAVAKVLNILSGVAWFNYNPKSKAGVMQNRPAEVLNLQVGNAYKGAELWDSRKHFEELICDYLGYITVKNEKRERMNTSEVNNDNSVAMVFYKASTKARRQALEEYSKIDKGLKLVENIPQNEGGEENDSKDNMGKSNSTKTNDSK